MGVDFVAMWKMKTEVKFYEKPTACRALANFPL